MTTAAKPVVARQEHPNGGVSYLLECPGCGFSHSLRVEGDAPRWSFNGDVVRPTFTPSLLCRYRWAEEQEQRVCHSFITDGQIRFLSDCTHKLAGKTVALEPIE